MINAKINELPTDTYDGNNNINNVKIGKSSYVSFNSIVYNTEIGNYCSIGPNTVIGFGNHPLSELSTSPSLYYNSSFFTEQEINQKKGSDYATVLIKNDVWIGSNVFIKNGVKIGNGAVIGAGSIVLKDVGDFEVVVGSPARVIKKRFSNDLIDEINKLSWWDLNEEEMIHLKEIIKEPTVQKIQDYLKQKN